VAKYSDIGTAFRAATKREPSGRLVVTSVDFVRELEAVNHHYTPHEGEDRCYFMIGMGRIM